MKPQILNCAIRGRELAHLTLCGRESIRVISQAANWRI
jgi:hypothetical protein